MIYGIASYHRPECRTVRTLLEAGVSKSNIVISVQDDDDYAEYRRRHKGIAIVYREADSAAGNRNTLLKEIKERPLCLLDDDIVSFGVYGKNFKVNTPEALSALEGVCASAKKNGCTIAGIAATGNSIIARARSAESIDVLLQGSVLLFMDDKTFFDERFKMVEDYEICLKAIYGGQHTLRDNRLVANKPQNGTNAGGLHDRYVRGELPFWIAKLEKLYPIFKANKQKNGGSIKWT